jgi:polar amino acid transport system substrate-binding protein
MRIFRLAAFAAAIVAAGIGSHPVSAQILMGVPSGNLPLSEGTGSGFSGLFPDAIPAILGKAGVETKLETRPFARLYAELASQELGGAMSVLDTPQRRESAIFSKPLVTEYTVIVVPKGKAFKLDSFADLDGKTLGTRAGFSYSYFDSRPNIKREPRPDHVSNVRKMLAGRLDGVAVGSVTGLYVIREAGLGDQIEIIAKSLGAIGLSYGFSKKSLTEDKIAPINAAIDAYLASPDYKATLAKYKIEDLVRDYPALN